MELHFRVGDAQLGESWIRRVQWGGSGSLPGKPFLIWLHLLRCSSKDLSGEKKQAYPLPQVNSAAGPSHFPSPNGSLYKTKGCGTAGLFCIRCLCMDDFKLSSQFKKFYVYMASMVKFLEDISRLPLFCLFNNVLKVW